VEALPLRVFLNQCRLHIHHLVKKVVATLQWAKLGLLDQGLLDTQAWVAWDNNQHQVAIQLLGSSQAPQVATLVSQILLRVQEQGIQALTNFRLHLKPTANTFSNHNRALVAAILPLEAKPAQATRAWEAHRRPQPSVLTAWAHPLDLPARSQRMVVSANLKHLIQLLWPQLLHHLYLYHNKA